MPSRLPFGTQITCTMKTSGINFVVNKKTRELKMTFRSIKKMPAGWRKATDKEIIKIRCFMQEGM